MAFAAQKSIFNQLSSTAPGPRKGAIEVLMKFSELICHMAWHPHGFRHQKEGIEPTHPTAFAPQAEQLKGRKKLTEIHVGCNAAGFPDCGVKATCPGMPVCGSHWYPDSPQNRETLRIILESCNEIYGAGTHWIEERQAHQKAHAA